MTPVKILFYYPSNKRTVALETLLLEFRKRGNEILILTTCIEGDFHKYMKSQGFEIYTHPLPTSGILYYIQQVLLLVKFCKKHNVDIIHSHLQHVNFIAAISQYFIKSRVVVFRHHFRYIDSEKNFLKKNRNEQMFDRVINRLAKTIVVPSKGVYNGIKIHEQVDMNKIKIIPYLYDFAQYQQPDKTEVEKIKLQYPCKLRLIMVSRLIKLKRHHLVFPLIKELTEAGYDIKLLVLDEGPEKETLEKYLAQHKLNQQIIMLGFRTDFINFMAAADLLIQPSLTDASNSAAKEFALFGKTIAVSDDVGDYNEYVKHNENGYLIPVKSSTQHMKEIIIDAYNHPEKLEIMGQLLKKEVLLKFDISNSREIMDMYEKL